MKHHRHKLTPILVAVGVLALVCFLQIWSAWAPNQSERRELSLLERLEAITYDARVRLAARFKAPISDQLGVIFLDDVTFTKLSSVGFGQLTWPWPRFIYGKLVRELKAQGAAAVGLDILFAEEHQPSPVTDMVEISEGTTNTLSSDEFFAREMQRASNVVIAAERDVVPAAIFRKAARNVGSVTSVPDYGVLRRVHPFVSRPAAPHPKLQELAQPLDLDFSTAQIREGKVILNSLQGGEVYEFDLKPNGALDLGQFGEDSGSVDQPPFIEERIWNLGIVLAAHELGLDLAKPLIERGSITLLGKDRMVTLPLDEDGMLYVDWNLKFSDIQSGKKGVASDNLLPLLFQDGRDRSSNDLDARFARKLVVVGSTATGNNYSDLGATPLEEDAPLLTKHLNIANSILTGRFIQRAPRSFELLLMLLLGGLAASITWRCSRVFVAIGAICVIALAYVAIACLLYVEARYWLPIVLPLGGGLALPHFSMVTYRLLFEQGQRRHVTEVFNKIVSPDVVKDLIDAESLALGGARREISIFFADVRGFTEFTDQNQAAADAYVAEHKLDAKAAEEVHNQQAAETLLVVNTYLATIADVIKKHNGTLDKYIGDCVMAFWGAPTAAPQHAVLSVRAAMEAQKKLLELNNSRAEVNRQRARLNAFNSEGKNPLPMLPLLSVGTGINTGAAIVGLMGSDAHILNYTVFGREVNVAARLEGLSGKNRIIISEATHRHLLRDDPALAARCIPLEPVHVKGIAAAVNIYEVQWRDAEPASPSVTATAQAALA